MCPLRIILLFLSATLAGYFAWKTARSSSPEAADDIFSSASTPMAPEGKQEFSFRKVVKDGFLVLVDMASGRHLWRNLRATEQRKERR